MSSVKSIRSRCANPFHKEIHLVKFDKFPKKAVRPVVQKTRNRKTNDGNTTRRFFDDPVTSSEITGIDIGLIKQFNTLLKTMFSGFEIDSEHLVGKLSMQQDSML